MPKKIRELKAMLRKAGFTQIPKRGKGSHTVWAHPLYNGSITLSGKDSKDAQRYQEQDVKRDLRRNRIPAMQLYFLRSSQMIGIVLGRKSQRAIGEVKESES